jgi:hypothetical protein
MSDKIDRRIGNGGPLFPVLALVLILAAAAGGYVWFWKTGEQDSGLSSGGQTAPIQAVRPDEPVTLIVFIPGESGLTTGSLQARRQPDSQLQAREALNAAFADSRVAAVSLMRDVSPRSFFIDESDTAYVDLGRVSQSGAKASAQEELFALYAIVNTLMQNFDEIRKVRFLVEGKEEQTLAGHIDLSGTFTKRMDLVRQ